MKRVSILLVVFLFFSFFGSSALAQSPTQSPGQILPPQEQPPRGVDLSISPTFLSLITDPGKSVEAEFLIRSRNVFTEYLELRIVKYETSPDGQSLIPTDIEASDPFPTWLSFSEEQFSLDSNETKTITVTVSPPSSAALGYYYAIMVSRVAPITGEGSALISGSPLISLLLNVRSPNAKRELQIADFKTDNFFYEFLPTKFSVGVKNTGNVHVVPVGDIFIDWGSQKEIAVLRINPGNGNVLPQTTRTFDVTWDVGFAVQKPKVENGRVVYDSDGNPVLRTGYDFTKADQFRIGKYTANLILVYDNGERDVPIEATVSFWVIPWRILVGVLFVFITPALVVYLFMRMRYGKKK